MGRNRRANNGVAGLERRQGIFWMCTIPHGAWNPPTSLPVGMSWIRGQKECGETTGYVHWQVVAAFREKKSLKGVCEVFGSRGHYLLTKSAAANDYVWKDDTSVGERFEFGVKPICRSSKQDWESVWNDAVAGNLLSIPADIRIRYYRTLLSIGGDHAEPVESERTIYVFWGPPNTGKSRDAWESAGSTAFPKDPCSKFWYGYRGQKNVVIDEFRGNIDISHILRWTDRYPCNVEIKGSSRPLSMSKMWITSNISPSDWYPNVSSDSVAALLRRFQVTDFT